MVGMGGARDFATKIKTQGDVREQKKLYTKNQAGGMTGP